MLQRELPRVVVFLAGGALSACNVGDPSSEPKECPNGQVRSPSGDCPKKCDPGNVVSADNGCEPAGLPTTTEFCPPGTWSANGGPCLAAGLPVEKGACLPGFLANREGECIAAGVPPSLCGVGFSPAEDGGCFAVIPAAPCAAGEFAIPGETACHEVAPCGSTAYGAAPAEPDTQYVNAAYAGGTSDGSFNKPWLTIQEGANAALPGAVVAIAAGEYTEDVELNDKPVRLWGRCPAMVTIHAATTGLKVRAAASGTEVHNIGFGAGEVGVFVLGAEDVTLERLWVHGTLTAGIQLVASSKPSVAIITDTLVEGVGKVGAANPIGIDVQRSVAQISRSAVRGTKNNGLGLIAYSTASGAIANVTLSASVLEGNDQGGLYVVGSKVAVDTTLVQDHGQDGVVAVNSAAQRSDLTVTSSVIEGSNNIGLAFMGSDGRVTGSTVRVTPGSDGLGMQVGRDLEADQASLVNVEFSTLTAQSAMGIRVLASTATILGTRIQGNQTSGSNVGAGIWAVGGATVGGPSVLNVEGSVVADNPFVGILVDSAVATVTTTEVSRTKDVPSVTESFGYGIGVETSDPLTPGDLTLSASLVRDNQSVGVLVTGAIARVESTEVRGTVPTAKDPESGRGISAQTDPKTAAPADVTVRSSLVTENYGIGISSIGSKLLVEGVVVQGTQASDEAPALGMGVVGRIDSPSLAPADLTVRGSLIQGNRAAGVLVVGAAATVEDTVIQDTLPEMSTGMWGRGVFARVDSTTKKPSTLTLRRSQVSNNVGFGVGIYGSNATIEATEIVDTGPNPENGSYGIGLQIWNHAESGNRAFAEVTRSVIERNHSGGVLISGGDVKLFGVRIAATQAEPSSGFFGRGIGAQYDLETQTRATLLLHDCDMSDNRDMGVFIAGSDATIEHTLVGSTSSRESDGQFGDGTVALAFVEAANLDLKDTWILKSARAGIANFGSNVSFSSLRIECAGFDLNGQTYEGSEPTFDDNGNTLCGCPEATAVCEGVSADLQAPEYVNIATESTEF